jgi:hypothetical protein
VFWFRVGRVTTGVSANIRLTQVGPRSNQRSPHRSGETSDQGRTHSVLVVKKEPSHQDNLAFVGLA